MLSSCITSQLENIPQQLDEPKPIILKDKRIIDTSINQVNYLQKAEIAKKKNEYEIAISYYSQAIDLNPNSIDLYKNRSDLLKQMNQQRRAIEDLHKVLEINPNDINSLYEIGLDSHNRGFYDNAIFFFKKALLANNQLAYIHNQLGLSFRSKKEYSKSIKCFNNSILIDNKNFEYFFNRGISWYYKKDYDRAIQDYNKGLTIKPNIAYGYNNRGVFWMHKSEIEKATKDFMYALKINKYDADVLSNCAIAFLKKAELTNSNNNMKSKEYIQKASSFIHNSIKINPYESDYYFNEGYIHFNEAQVNNQTDQNYFCSNYFMYQEIQTGGNDFYAECYNDGCNKDSQAMYKIWSNSNNLYQKLYNYTQLINENDEKIDNYYNRAFLWYQKGFLPEAIADIDLYIDKNPNNYVAYFLRANSYRANDYYDEAIKEYSKVIKLKNNFTEAYFRRALVYKSKYSNKDKNEENLRIKNQIFNDLTKTIELDKNYARAYVQFGHYWYYMQNNLDKGLEYYQKAIKLCRSCYYFDAYINIGKILAEKQNTAKAIKVLKDGLNLFPYSDILYKNLAVIYYDIKDFDRSIQYLTKAIELNPNNSELYIYRGNSWMQVKQYTKALTDYQKAPRKKVSCYRGFALFKMGDYERACKDICTCCSYNICNTSKESHADETICSQILKEDLLLKTCKNCKSHNNN